MLGCKNKWVVRWPAVGFIRETLAECGPQSDKGSDTLSCGVLRDRLTISEMHRSETTAEWQFINLKYKTHMTCTFSSPVHPYMRIYVWHDQERRWIYFVKVWRQKWWHLTSPRWVFSLLGVRSPQSWWFLGRQKPGMGVWSKCWNLSSFPAWLSISHSISSPQAVSPTHLHHWNEADDSQFVAPGLNLFSEFQSMYPTSYVTFPLEHPKGISK